MKLLYLTKTEKDLFSKLPKKIREYWEDLILDEEKELKETPEDIEMRMMVVIGNLDKTGIEFLEDLIKQTQTNQTVTDLPWEILSQKALTDILFVLGNAGLSEIIKNLLTKTEKNDDLEAVHLFSQARHYILENSILVKT